MITDLKITNLRNLKHTSIKPSQCNLIIGDNGSGKTSLLEAIFLLARGKSFRTHQPKKYISHHQASSTVFAKFTNDTTLAIQKHSDASTLLKLNGDTVRTQSEITKLMPTLLIDPSSMEMLEQGSAARRQLLDWLAFHIQPDFYKQWLAYQRLLKQRNSLLKQINSISNSHRQQFAAWDSGLADYAQLIHKYRQAVFEKWVVHFAYCIQQLLPKYHEQLTVSYQAGYDTAQPLDALLNDRLMQDLQQGYTRIGCHRADIQIHWSKKDEDSNIKDLAVNVLSRGEKKLLITALKLSQLLLLHDYAKAENANKHATTLTNTMQHKSTDAQTIANNGMGNDRQIADGTVTLPIVLLDDITAELDKNAVAVLLKVLTKVPCQLFITSLSTEIIDVITEYWQDSKTFYIQHQTLGNASIDTEVLRHLGSS